jgi:hypothetical protein
MLCKSHVNSALRMMVDRNQPYVNSTLQTMVDPCQISIIPGVHNTAQIIFNLCKKNEGAAS